MVIHLRHFPWDFAKATVTMITTVFLVSIASTAMPLSMSLDAKAGEAAARITARIRLSSTSTTVQITV